MPYAERAEVEFLANYYLLNRSRFTNDEMTRVTGAGGTFYLTTANQTIDDNTFSILMYTDISSAMEFTNSMNRILGLLLVLSGLLSLVISVAMSARFKRAVVRLCGYAESITKDVFTKEEAADIILSEGQKMAVLVDELLYISRIDNATKTPNTISGLDVKNLLYECGERVKPIAQKSGKQVTVTALSQAISINADSEKLERAITNILSNAIRHAAGDVEVSYHVTGNNLEIVIKDDGSGIDPNDLPHIFERFYKGENGNYGLGLAISKDIVKSLGGHITAKNKNAPGSGAVFTVCLPLS